MRFVRCLLDGRISYGTVESDDRVAWLSAAPWHGGNPTGDAAPLASVRLLAPCEPSKIVAVGINYRPHAEEIHFEVPTEPLIFLKPPSAVIGPGDTIVLPAMSSRVEYEGELAAVIGRPARQVSQAEALAHVFGYTCINDVTARDLQKRDVQFTRAKGFDTFAPLGPWIETDLDPDRLTLETRLNGELRQSSSTAQMIRPLAELISFISEVMTLLPGDVIATGTPAGVGWLADGDTVTVAIEGIGTLTNTVRA